MVAANRFSSVPSNRLASEEETLVMTRISPILKLSAIAHGFRRPSTAMILTVAGSAILFGFAGSAFSQQSQGSSAPAKVTRYLIVSGDSSSGSWDSRDEGRLTKWRAEFGSEFAWFRQDGRDYLVTDDRTLAELQEAMAPQREVNGEQAEVNQHQEEVNRQQEQVNSHQENVNRAQEEVNRQQNRVNEGAGDQDRVNRLQSGVNGKQQTVNSEQEKVNQKQAVVNTEQDKVNRMQARASVKVEHALQIVFDSARRRGVAREVR